MGPASGRQGKTSRRQAPVHQGIRCVRIRRPWHLPTLALALSGLAAGCASASNQGQLEATLRVLSTQVASQATRLADHATFIAHLATRIPPRPPVATGAPVPTPFVTGSVQLEEGRCCVGGMAGRPIRIRAAFQADSPQAPVIEMRLRAGVTRFTEADFTEDEWEPFSESKEFEFLVPLNWTGFTVSVQFRDARGNLSQVFADDVSVEGMPEPPTIAP